LNTDGGGGLVNNGTLTIINSVFSANTVDNQYGGAILNNSAGNLTITGSTFSNNSAFSGGAIANYNQLTVRNSTFTGNGGAGTDSGGAIYTTGFSGTLAQTITNSTFSGNTANIGGAVWSSRTHTITNSTFSGNVANYSDSGGAVWQDAELLNFANNIMANSSGGDCDAVSAGNIGTNINNLVEQTNFCVPALSVDPSLGSLANNGGPNQTFSLLPGSAAINAGDNSICDDNPGPNNLDQRGIARPNGDNCDLGAYEHQDTGGPSVTAFTASNATSLNIPITTFTALDDGVITAYLITESATPPTIGNPNWTASAPSNFTVANAGNHTLYPWAKDDAGNISAVYGSPDTVSVCFPAITVTNANDSGAGSLRQALDDACDDTATITFAPGLSGATIHLQSTLTINNPAASFKYLTIDGSSLASQITLSGDSDNNGTGDVRVIEVTDNANSALLNITLNSLTFTKGQASGDGGAILNWAYLTITNSTFSNNSATGAGGAINNNRPLTITNSTFSGNSSTGSGGGGGGIMNNSTLTVSGSTFSGNTGHVSDSNGGAIYITSNNSATITNSTFSGNSATAGGAIITTGDLTITNSTISGNTATYSSFVSGLDIEGGTTNLSNTIIANSTFGLDCMNNSTIGTNTNNLIEDGTCSPALSGDPMLGSLANNGGSTQTFALLAGSKAIDAGDDTICAASPVNNLDQRGITRPNSAHCDIGAYEYQDASVPTVTAFTPTSRTNSLNVPITAFTASDDATVAGYLITESSTPPSPGAAGWTASPPATYTVAGDGSYTLYPWAKDAAGHVSALFGSPASVTIDRTAPTAGGLVAANVTSSGGTTYSFTVTFSDNLAVDITSIDGGDIRVTGPGGFEQLATLVSVTPLGNGTLRTATYQITAPGGAWDTTDNGTYTISLEANQVVDTAGNPVGAASLGSFLVSLNYTMYLPLVR
jgi:predicted outer membrane repeat protein